MPDDLDSLQAVAVFCGSSPGHRPVYIEAAEALGSELGRRGIALVYGGGDRGLMGAVARAAAAAGSAVTGVTVGEVASTEGADATPELGELLVARSLSDRKRLMAERSQAFVMLPGGFGTLDELFEMVTWNQLRIHRKPCGILDVDGFFGPLLDHIARSVAEGFVRADHAADLAVATTPAALLDDLERSPLRTGGGGGW